MLHLRPELVKGRSPDFSPGLGQEWNDYLGYGASTQTGVWGKPSAADPEVVGETIEAIMEHRVRYIRETFAKLDEMLGPLPDGPAAPQR